MAARVQPLPGQKNHRDTEYTEKKNLSVLCASVVVVLAYALASPRTNADIFILSAFISVYLRPIPVRR